MGRYCVGPAMAVDWGDETPPAVVRRVLLRRALASFLPYRRMGAGVVGCIVAGAILGLVPALVTKALIDGLSGTHRSFGHLAVLVAGGVAASLVGGLIGVGESYLRTVISQGIMLDYRNQLFERLLGQSVGYFTDRRSGDVLSRVTNDVSGIEDVVGETLFGVAESAIVGVSTLVFMAVLDWRLTVFVMVIMPIFLLPARRVGTRIFRARKAIQEKLSEIGVHTQEVLGISGLLLVKAFGTRARERQRLRVLSEELRDLEFTDQAIEQHLIAAGHGDPTTVTAAGYDRYRDEHPDAPSRSTIIGRYDNADPRVPGGWEAAKAAAARRLRHNTAASRRRQPIVA